MRVFLQIESEPYAGRKVWLRKPRTSLGSGRSADIRLRTDPELAETHFSIDLDEEDCVLRDLAGTGAIWFNQQQVDETALRDKDQFTAGKSRFTVLIVPEPGDAALEGRDPEGGELDYIPIANQSAAVACAGLEMSEEDVPGPREEDSPLTYADRLLEGEWFMDAIRVIGHVLPKRAAVWWACRCVQEGCAKELKPLDANALEAAWQWVIDPSEEHRQVAYWEAERSEFSGPGCWPAMGAFWTGESISSPELPPAAPLPTLVSTAVMSSATLAAYHDDPEGAERRFREFYATGRGMAKQESYQWPDSIPG